MKIHRTPHELSDLRAIDGDTIEAWLTYDQLVAIRVIIRLPGIEAGEIEEAAGQLAQRSLQVILFQYAQHQTTLATHPRTRDNHGRIVVLTFLFGTGQSLCALLLASGRYWRRGAHKPTTTPPQKDTSHKQYG